MYLEFTTNDISLFEEDYFALGHLSILCIENFFINIDRSRGETSINGNEENSVSTIVLPFARLNKLVFDIQERSWLIFA